MEIPAAAAETSEDVSDLLRDAQKVPPAFALKLQQNRNDLSATFSSLLSDRRESLIKSEVSYNQRFHSVEENELHASRFKTDVPHAHQLRINFHQQNWSAGFLMSNVEDHDPICELEL